MTFWMVPMIVLMGAKLKEFLGIPIYILVSKRFDGKSAEIISSKNIVIPEQLSDSVHL